MEPNTVNGVTPEHTYTIEECLGYGRDSYDDRNFPDAVEWLTKAAVLLNQPWAHVPWQLRNDVYYFLLKAYLMILEASGTRPELPVSFIVLEDQVLKDDIGNRPRAVKWYDRFGRLGLRLHDLLERHHR